MPLEKFSSQAELAVLQEIKQLAKAEGKQLQVLVNEAFTDLIEKRKSTKPRQFVAEALACEIRVPWMQQYIAPSQSIILM